MAVQHDLIVDRPDLIIRVRLVLRVRAVFPFRSIQVAGVERRYWAKLRRFFRRRRRRHFFARPQRHICFDVAARRHGLSDAGRVRGVRRRGAASLKRCRVDEDPSGWRRGHVVIDVCRQFLERGDNERRRGNGND